jgi:hypothetical protein
VVPFDRTNDAVWTLFAESDMRPFLGRALVHLVTSTRPRAFKTLRARPIIQGVTRIRARAASLASVLGMAGVFVAVGLLAGPPAPHPAKGGARPQGVCFLHDLVR